LHGHGKADLCRNKYPVCRRRAPERRAVRGEAVAKVVTSRAQTPGQIRHRREDFRDATRRAIPTEDDGEDDDDIGGDWKRSWKKSPPRFLRPAQGEIAPRPSR